jgi:hypothetical protein
MKFHPARTMVMAQKIESNMLLDPNSGLVLDDIRGSQGVSYGVVESVGPDVERYHPKDKILFYTRMAAGLQILTQRFFLFEQTEIIGTFEPEPEENPLTTGVEDVSSS